MVDMKDSGVHAIGDIPNEWNVIRTKFLADISIGLVTTMTANYVDNQKDGVPLIRNGNIRCNKIDTKGMAFLDKKFADKNKHRQLRTGHIATVHTGDVGTSIVIPESFDGCMGFATIQSIPKDNISSDFLCWFFNSAAFKNQCIECSTGDGRHNLNLYDFVDLYVAIPSYENQIVIVTFLDKKCKEIDDVCSDIEKQIEILEEYKKSIITETVTKGLNSDVEMKESRIDWIGMIPKHWEVKKVKHICDTRNEKYSIINGNLKYFALENIVSWDCKYVETENEYDLDGSNLCYKNDVVFGKLRPYLAKTFLVDYDRCCSSEFAIFCNFKGLANYFLYVFTTQGFVETVDNSTAGVKMPRANIEFIKNVYIPIAPIEEQKAIVEYLIEKCAEIDSIIADKKSQLETLAEYKKSLIYEYVTGKKEVPENA